MKITTNRENKMFKRIYKIGAEFMAASTLAALIVYLVVVVLYHTHTELWREIAAQFGTWAMTTIPGVECGWHSCWNSQGVFFDMSTIMSPLFVLVMIAGALFSFGCFVAAAKR